MRLIDADALRADYQAILDRGDMFCEYDIIGMVDNAPTIEPFEPDYVGAERLKARQRGYEEGYHNGMRNGIALNPKIKQGEWKITEAYPHKVYCGACYKTYAHQDWEVWEDGSLPRDYCPNCGADMRKEASDE